MDSQIHEAIEALKSNSKRHASRELQPVLISLINCRKVEIVNVVEFIAEVHNQRITSLTKSKAETINILEEFVEDNEAALTQMGIDELEALYSVQEVVNLTKQSAHPTRHVAISFLKRLCNKDSKLATFFRRNIEITEYLKNVSINEEKGFVKSLLDVTYAVATGVFTDERNIGSLLTVLMNFAIDKARVTFSPQQHRFIQN